MRIKLIPVGTGTMGLASMPNVAMSPSSPCWLWLGLGISFVAGSTGVMDRARAKVRGILYYGSGEGISSVTGSSVFQKVFGSCSSVFQKVFGNCSSVFQRFLKLFERFSSVFRVTWRIIRP